MHSIQITPSTVFLLRFETDTIDSSNPPFDPNNPHHHRESTGQVVAKKGIVQQIQGFIWGMINFVGLFFSTVNPVRLRPPHTITRLEIHSPCP